MKRFLSHKAPVYRRALLLAIAAGVPLVFLRTVNDPVNVPKLWWLMLLLPAVVLLRVAEGLQDGLWNGLRRLWVPAVAITAPLLIAWLISPYKGWALFGNYPRFTGLLPYLFVALYGILVADAFRERQRDLAWAVVGAGAVVGFYGLIQVAGFDIFDWSIKGGALGKVAVSTLGNPNFTGGFLAIALPLALALLVIDPSRRRWAIAAAGLIGLGCLASRSEGGMAAAIGGTLVLGGFFFSSRDRRLPAIAAAGAGLIAIALVAAVASTIYISREGPLPATVARRGDWWQAAGAMAADAPLAGKGPAAFAIDGFGYRTAEDGRQTGFDYTDEPHSVPLSFLTSAGVLGLAGFVLAAAWLLRQGWRLATTDLLQAGFLGAVVAYYLQALISIDTVPLRVAFWTVAGGMLATSSFTTSVDSAVERPKKSASKAQRRKAPQQPLKGTGIIAVTAVVALAAVWGAFRFIAADAGVRHAKAIFSEGRLVEGAEAFQAALSLRADNSYRSLYADLLGQSALGFRAYADPRAQQLADDFYQRTRDAYAYLEEFPHPIAITEYARFLRAWAAYEPAVNEESLALFQRAKALDPNNPALASEVEAAVATPPPPAPSPNDPSPTPSPS